MNTSQALEHSQLPRSGHHPLPGDVLAALYGKNLEIGEAVRALHKEPERQHCGGTEALTLQRERHGNNRGGSKKAECRR